MFLSKSRPDGESGDVISILWNCPNLAQIQLERAYGEVRVLPKKEPDFPRELKERERTPMQGIGHTRTRWWRCLCLGPWFKADDGCAARTTSGRRMIVRSGKKGREEGLYRSGPAGRFHGPHPRPG